MAITEMHSFETMETQNNKLNMILERILSQRLLKKLLLLGFGIIWMVSLGVYSARLFRETQWAHASGTVIGSHKQKGKKLYNPFISFVVTEQYKNEHGKMKQKTSSYTFTSLYAGKENEYPLGINVDVLYNPRHIERVEMASELTKQYKFARFVAGSLTLVALIGIGAMLGKKYAADANEDEDEEATVEEGMSYCGGLNDFDGRQYGNRTAVEEGMPYCGGLNDADDRQYGNKTTQLV